ncbi:MAG TPA: SUMF1/EgtB/PvdO family nonheme iron enzyme [Blastocatellia bacterium]|nr:SUMF1/EgtB/PvdO family nonheme iron enzyme [Blastocatellia bacterium]
MDDMSTKEKNEKYGSASGVRRALAASLMQTEGARSRPALSNPGERTTAKLNRPHDLSSKELSWQAAGTQQPVAAGQSRDDKTVVSGKANRVPLWVWWAVGAILMLALSWLLFFLLSKDPGFILIVRGAPAESYVYVDNKSLGTTRADGTIRVSFLEPGKRVVRVSKEGFEDFNTSLIGKDGETKSVIYSAQPATETALSEIDYAGPMMLVKAGEFIMGADDREQNEKPAHKVTLDDYYIDKFEVTNAQYKRFCDETRRPYPTNPHWDEGYFNNNPDSPVVGVNWNDAAAYAKWAGKRLPTEQEWEKAASWDPAANQKRQWPWGNTPDAARINLGADRPGAVGRQTAGASAYGVQDLSGSVAEWVDASYSPYPGNQSPDPNFGANNRVVRGGHFRLDINDVRTTARYYHGPEFESAEKKLRSWLTGFRCAVSADDARLREFLRAKASGR